MRKLFPLFLIVLTAQLDAADTISIATLNCEFLSTRYVHVKFGLNLDEKFWTELQKNTWKADGYREARYQEAANSIAEAILTIDADIIVLTEVARIPKNNNGEFVTPNDLTILHDRVAATYPHMTFGDSRDRKTWQNVAVLSKRPFEGEPVRIIPGREGYFKELDDADSESETTISKGMSAVVKVDDEPVYIFAVHLRSEAGGHENDAQRIAQASIVRRNYLKLLNQGVHVIVVGDLNDYRGQPALRRIRGLEDIGEDIAQTGGPTFFKKKDSESTGDFNARMRDHWTYEYAGQRNQIDHILISQSLRNRCTKRNYAKAMDIEFIDIDKTIANTEHKVTDHRAVKLTLNFLDTHLE